MDEVVRLRMSDVRVKRALEFRDLDDDTHRAERERFDAALNACSRQAWWNATVVRAAHELGIAWLIMRKRAAQFAVARVLRRMAMSVEPRRVR